MLKIFFGQTYRVLAIFLRLYLVNLYWLVVHTLCNQLLSELILDLFNILHTCYMHIEYVHEEI